MLRRQQHAVVACHFSDVDGARQRAGGKSPRVVDTWSCRGSRSSYGRRISGRSGREWPGGWCQHGSGDGPRSHRAANPWFAL